MQTSRIGILLVVLRFNSREHEHTNRQTQDKYYRSFFRGSTATIYVHIRRRHTITDEYDTSNTGLSIASLVLGIVGILSFSTGLSFIFSILAIIFAAQCMKKKEGIQGLVTAGLVLGIVGLSIWALLAVFLVSIFGIFLLFAF